MSVNDQLTGRLFPAPEWPLDYRWGARRPRFGWTHQRRAVGLTGPRRQIVAALERAVAAGEDCGADLWTVTERGESRSSQRIFTDSDSATLGDWVAELSKVIEARASNAKTNRPCVVVIDDVPRVLARAGEATAALLLDVLHELAVQAQPLNMYVALVYLSGRRWRSIGDRYDQIELDLAGGALLTPAPGSSRVD